MLNKEPYFRGNFKDYSVTKDEPLCAANGDILIGTKLNKALREQIGHASVVLIPAGMWAKHSKWINKEIDIAKSFDKPIIAIRPWGAERVSSVANDADETVNWNGSSIVDAIKKHAG